MLLQVWLLVDVMAVITRQLVDLLAPTIEAMGFELWGIEYFPRGKTSLLRIYIDSDQGITIDHCAEVSSQVSRVLDVEDPIRSAYTLEVSSPGLDRPLFEERHYRQYLGRQIKLRLSSSIDGRKNFFGQLIQVNEGQIELELTDQSAGRLDAQDGCNTLTVTIDLLQVIKAQLIAE